MARVEDEDGQGPSAHDWLIQASPVLDAAIRDLRKALPKPKTSGSQTGYRPSTPTGSGNRSAIPKKPAERPLVLNPWHRRDTFSESATGRSSRTLYDPQRKRFAPPETPWEIPTKPTAKMPSIPGGPAKSQGVPQNKRRGSLPGDTFKT